MKKSSLSKQYDIEGEVNAFCNDCEKIIRKQSDCCNNKCLKDFKKICTTN